VRRIPSVVLGIVAFATSAAVLVLEIVAARLLAPYVGVTLETYTAIIGVILAGIASGAWIGGRLADRTRPGLLVGPFLMIGGLSSLAAIPLLRILGPNLRSTDPIPVIGLTASVFLLPSLILSMVPPLLTKAKLTDLSATGRTVGSLSALSTAGALTGSFVTGYVLVPNFRSRVIVGLISGSLIAMGAMFTYFIHDRKKPSQIAVTAALVFAVAASGIESTLTWRERCEMESSYFCARSEIALVGDSSKRYLVLDDGLHSAVDIDDPLYLEFEYIRAFRMAIDAWRPPPAKLRTLHIGGGGFTMPRYLKATRPGSDSLVFEVDAKLVRFDQNKLGLKLAADLRTKAGDGRQNLRREKSKAWDLVIGDAFGGQSVPWHLATREVAQDVRRVLADDGLYVLNVIDSPPQKFIKAEVATVQSVFKHVALLSYPNAFAGGMGANFIVVAANKPLPLQSLEGALANDLAVTGMVMKTGSAMKSFVGNAEVLTDEFGPVDQLFTP
jgi:spermidine synthase